MKIYGEGALEASKQEEYEHCSGHQMEKSKPAVSNICSFIPSFLFWAWSGAAHYYSSSWGYVVYSPDEGERLFLSFRQ